jgi:hypothetical protein
VLKSGRCVGQTTLPPSMSRMSQNVGASTSRNAKGLHGLYRENFIDGVWIGEWPRVLMHELSSTAQTLGSWDRFPLRVWISVCVYSVFVLFCG